MLSKKKCAYCGKEFVPNNGKQKCCCKKSNTYLWRKNNPEKVKIQEHKQDEKRKGVKRYNSNQRKKYRTSKKRNRKMYCIMCQLSCNKNF